MMRVTSFLALAFGLPSVALGDDGFHLQMLSSTLYPKAMCLDGSQGGFYLYNGTDTSTWIIEMVCYPAAPPLLHLFYSFVAPFFLAHLLCVVLTLFFRSTWCSTW